jgi:putative endonuclease
VTPPARGPSEPPDRRRIELGAAGEDLAVAWYEAHGYEVLARNWRTRSGELDLVLSHGRSVVFSEVKTRRGDGFGAPVEAVSATKRRRLRVLAALWIEERATPWAEIRFDVVSVLWPHGGVPEIDVIEDAF